MKNIFELIDKIKITPDMTAYNVCNILYGKSPGTDTDIDPIWKANRKRLRDDDDYKDTILGLYFRHKYIRDDIYTPGYNATVLKLCIDKYIKTIEPPLPVDNEVVMHIRLGDRVTEGYKWNYTDTINFDYIPMIRSLSQSDSKITIVTNMSFCNVDKTHSNTIAGVPHDDQYLSKARTIWSMTKDRIQLNREKISDVIQDIMIEFPDNVVDIYSSDSVDNDICYIYKNGFVGNKHSCWTGIFGFNNKY